MALGRGRSEVGRSEERWKGGVVVRQARQDPPVSSQACIRYKALLCMTFSATAVTGEDRKRDAPSSADEALQGTPNDSERP